MFLQLLVCNVHQKQPQTADEKRLGQNVIPAMQDWDDVKRQTAQKDSSHT